MSCRSRRCCEAELSLELATDSHICQSDHSTLALTIKTKRPQSPHCSLASSLPAVHPSVLSPWAQGIWSRESWRQGQASGCFWDGAQGFSSVTATPLPGFLISAVSQHWVLLSLWFNNKERFQMSPWETASEWVWIAHSACAVANLSTKKIYIYILYVYSYFQKEKVNKNNDSKCVPGQCVRSQGSSGKGS